MASAKAAKVSISKLIQSISTVFKGGESGGKAIEPMIKMTIATMFITN